MSDLADWRRPGGVLEPSKSHGWFPFSPIPRRPPMTWPRGQGVAVSLVIDLRAVEWEPPDSTPVIAPPGGRGTAPYPDFPRMSHREFGHRVGVFRLFDIVRTLGISPALVVDVLTAEHYASAIDHVAGDVGEFIAGGLSGSRAITSLMGEEEELDYIGTTLDRLTSRLGTRPTGWLGVEHSESARTPGLLGRCGIEYLADWGNDERPYPMAGGRVWSFPISWELCDVRAMFERGVLPLLYASSIIEAFEVLCAETPSSGRVLALHLHPWVSGQAFRADAIEEALTHLVRSGAGWWASPGTIVSWCRSQADRMQDES